MPQLSASLRDGYQRLFDTCEIRERHVAIVDGLAEGIVENRMTYHAVEAEIGVPWFVVGLIHAMEAAPPLSMSGHLHNGDPLTGRTIHVPAGRPEMGDPPFSWHESAVDALTVHELHRWRDWSVPGVLYVLEQYNGWGYRLYHPDVPTPYLWSFTNHYTRGKYTGDGVFSAAAVSQQCGAAALLIRMLERGDIETDGGDLGGPIIRFEKGAAPHVEALQRFLNACPGLAVRIDGKPGTQTSAAMKRTVGHYLVGDPRAD